MKNTVKAFTCGTVATIAALGLSQAVHGQAAGDVTESQAAVGSSWSGTPGYATGPGPTTGSGGTSQDNDSWGGDANGTAGVGALGQTFVLSSAGTLSSVQLVMSGSAATYNVELYDLGPTSALSGYPTVPQQINSIGNGGTASTSGGAGGSGGANLLAWTYAAGTYTSTYDQFTFNGAAANVQDLVTLSFGNLDGNVQLQANELYMLSLDPTANANSTWWVRGGVPVSAYNTGMGYNADGSYGMQNFEGKSGSGNPNSGIRDFDLAVEVVPEPSTIALGVIGASSLLLRRRK